VRLEFLPALRDLYPGFDAFPDSVKVALMDMIYSLGKGGLSKFNTLKVALSRRDFRAASLAARRQGARPERDEENRKLIEAGA
jgi:hypothetical protein